MPKIWILVVDSRCAHFFRKPNHHLEKIGIALPDETIESDRSNTDFGRMSNPAGGGDRNRMEDHDTAIHREVSAFIKSVAAYINDAVAQKALDRLILVAPPKTLGLLRKSLNQKVHEHINAELDKDLSHLDEKELYDYLTKMLWV